MKSFLAVCCFATLFMLAFSTREKVRFVGQELWKYVVSDENINFNATINWCRELGGELPYIHTQADVDFLADQVINSHYIGWWIGLKRMNHSCSNYLDGSIVDYNFIYHNNKICSTCTSDNCALMLLSTYPKMVAFTNSSDVRKAICVIKLLSLEGLNNHSTALLSQIQTEIGNLGRNFSNVISDFRDEMHDKLTNLSLTSKTIEEQTSKMETRQNKFTASTLNDQSELKENFLSLSQKLGQQKALLIIVGVAVTVIVIALVLLLRQQSLKDSPDVVMRYRNGDDVVRSIEPSVYDTSSDDTTYLINYDNKTSSSPSMKKF